MIKYVYSMYIYIITRISFKTCVALYHDKTMYPHVCLHTMPNLHGISAHSCSCVLLNGLEAKGLNKYAISLAYKTCLDCSTKRWIFETMITRATCDKQIGYSRKFPTFLFFTSTETFACLVVWHTLPSSSGRKREQSQHTRPALNPSLRVATPSVASSSGHKCSER